MHIVAGTPANDNDFHHGLLGLAFAAVGNNGLDASSFYPANRALEHSDTIAVLNTDNTGRCWCCSNEFRNRPWLSRGIVGFDGHTSDKCASSFAAPRVAWLVAAAEATALDPPVRGLWEQQVSDQIRRFLKEAPDKSGVYLQAEEFLRNILLEEGERR